MLHGSRGTLAEQINHARERLAGRPHRPPRRVRASPAARSAIARDPKWNSSTGFGGFTSGGREYLTILDGNEHTPAPWINVVANPSFGFQVSTEGSGFTWSVNSQQNQLTPWSNDPVSDAAGEAIYVRDEETGEVWGPTALPIREKTASYSVRHGQGYSRFEHTSHGIVARASSICARRRPDQDLAAEDNQSVGARASPFGYGLCGVGARQILEPTTAPFIVTEIDPETGAIFARNPWSDQFG